MIAELPQIGHALRVLRANLTHHRPLTPEDIDAMVRLIDSAQDEPAIVQALRGEVNCERILRQRAEKCIADALDSAYPVSVLARYDLSHRLEENSAAELAKKGKA